MVVKSALLIDVITAAELVVVTDVIVGVVAEVEVVLVVVVVVVVVLVFVVIAVGVEVVEVAVMIVEVVVVVVGLVLVVEIHESRVPGRYRTINAALLSGKDLLKHL